jgi:muramoyltetrapeptide carboxypeptidase
MPLSGLIGECVFFFDIYLMIEFPPYLKKGDCIGVVAPAGYMPFENMETCVNTLQDWGYTLRLGATTQSKSSNYFSGTDEERIQDLQEMLDAKDVKAIFCARGGYGISRMIDRLSFKKFRKNPKWIIGFSDITLLQCHIYSKFGISGLHAPMAAAFNDNQSNNPYILSLKNALEGVTAEYQAGVHPFNRNGVAEGALVGGNLTLFTHTVGTPSDVKTRNRILFLEDIGEQLYNVDRMMIQLKRAGKLDKLAGLIIGGFTDSKDTDRPIGMTVEEIIREKIMEYDYPVAFGFPVSHEKENYALKIGGNYKLSVETYDVMLRESGEQ